MSRPKPPWRPPPREGVNASCVVLPSARVPRWANVLDFLVERLPRVSVQDWRERLQRHEVLDDHGQPVSADTCCQPGQRLWYWRQVPGEPVLPFQVQVRHQDELLVVADKPHFMTVSPVGQHARETLQARLQRQLGLDNLAPIHRLDRETAGLVVFAVQPRTRALYQALFSQRQVHKVYLAVAPPPPALAGAGPWERHSRIERSAGPMQMREVQGPPNAITRIEWLETRGAWARYRLEPLTGRTHQLRVHLCAMGCPIRGDRIYPSLWPQPAPGVAESHAEPLQLLAHELAFTDPVTGAPRTFRSQLSLQAW